MNKIDEKATHVGSDARDSPSGRRRFVRGVSIAIPVSLTVSARSALSATCPTASAAASIALTNSHNATGDIPPACNGLSPTSWAQLSVQQNSLQSTGVQPKQQKQQKQIETYIGQTKNFVDVFLTNDTALKQLQMQDAVANSNQSVNYFAAAYLNLVNNKVVGAYNLAQLKGMWAGLVTGYSPFPSSVVRWYEEDIKKYLAGTWS